MTTTNIYTSCEATSSTPVPSCAAHRLDSEQRKRLAVQALARSRAVTELAGSHQVSRKFVYQQAEKASEALDEAFAPFSDDEQVLFYLPVTKAWLRQVVLGLVLLCHSSFRGVVEFFRDLLDHSLSVGTVHNIVSQAVSQAHAINAQQDLSPIEAGTHDELFQTGQPVLAGIDLDSSYCYLLAAEAQRDAETWGIHLLDLAEHGLQPDYTVADGGQGLRAGQALAWPEVPCWGDVFHGLRPMVHLSQRLERRAYASMAQVEKLEQKMERAKQQRRGRSLSKKLAQARCQQTRAIDVADQVRTLAHWLQQDILGVSGPQAETRQQLYDFVVQAMRQLEEDDKKRIGPVRRTLENQRDTLLAFARQLDQELEQLAQRFEVPLSLVRDLLHLQTLDPAKPGHWQREAQLRQKLHGQFYFIQEAVIEAMHRVHRSSSLVENFNSRLRSYFFLRRHVGTGYLDLLRFFLNHRTFLRSEHPQRVGKSPAELMTGKKHAHWLELLGFTRFCRTAEAA